MPKIKLYVCCHQPTSVPEHPLLEPIQVGAALADRHFSGFLHDDVGENISVKNRSYCELTAQYWAWKNVDTDYFGFFHYRRYLYPDTGAIRPYRIEKAPSLPLLDKLRYGIFAELIQHYDLIAPLGENMYVPIREHYAEALFHHHKDLELVEEIVRTRSPEMTSALNTYLSGTFSYFGNIFIMNRELFHQYCAWLFPILEEFDRKADTVGYSAVEQRVDGYLAERLLGVYLTYERNRRKYLELPRVFFDGITGKLNYKNRVLYHVLPPGTRRRAYIKNFTKFKKEGYGQK